MTIKFKRVPAVDKCFAILDLLANSRNPLSINDIVKRLEFNKSTVFNMMHTLSDLKVLDRGPDGHFRLSTRLQILGSAATKGSELIQCVHPYLEEINQRTKLSAFLGIRSEKDAIILDKVDSAYNIKLSSEIGMRIPLLAGAAGKALLAQLDDDEFEQFLADTDLKKFTPYSITDKIEFKNMVIKARQDGIIFDQEEYIEGIIAFGLPLYTHHKYQHAAIWAVGVKRLVPEDKLKDVSHFLKKIVDKINTQFELAAGPFN